MIRAAIILATLGAVTLAAFVALRADDHTIAGPGLGVVLGPSLTGQGSAGAPLDVTGASSATAGQAATSNGAGGLTWATPSFSGSAATVSGTGSAGAPFSATPGNTAFTASAAAGLFGPYGYHGALNFNGSPVSLPNGTSSPLILNYSPATNPYVSFNGVYYLTRDIFATDMTVGTTYAVATQGYRIFVTGTLHLYGQISNLGLNGSGITGGAAGPSGLCSAGTAGGGGGNGVAGSASGAISEAWPFFTDGATIPGGAVNAPGLPGLVPGQGGSGGGSGLASPNYRAGGAAGAITSVGSGYGAPSWFGFQRCAMDYLNLAMRVGTGGGGGGGTGSPVGNGGGGGGAGGMVFVYARKLVTYYSPGYAGTISAAGGKGAQAPSSNCGGGGGGGGGLVVVYYGTRTHVGANPAVFAAAGGAGGAANGTGQAGGAGVAGFVYLVNMSGDGT